MSEVVLEIASWIESLQKAQSDTGDGTPAGDGSAATDTPEAKIGKEQRAANDGTAAPNGTLVPVKVTENGEETSATDAFFEDANEVAMVLFGSHLVLGSPSPTSRSRRSRTKRTTKAPCGV